MKMTDQGGNMIPDDLVVLPEIKDLNREDFCTILNADWYDVYISMDPDDKTPTIFLMTSARTINYLSEIDLDELGGLPIKALKVDDRLKRGSIVDGFYHA